MRRLALLFFPLAAAACVAHTNAASCPLATRMNEEIARDAPVEVKPDSELSSLKQKQFLFVAGFLSETIPGYFNDNVAVVHDEFGAEATRMFPSSVHDLSFDADAIHQQVLELVAKNGKPVVVVGHSKGGAGAVLMALRYPELIISGQVDRVISIQGAIGGSPIADGVVKTLPLNWDGLQSLQRQKSHAAFEEARAKLPEKVTPDQLEKLQSRIFFVRSAELDGNVTPELLITHNFLNGYGSGKNDGLLLEEDMKLDGVGVDLGVLKGDHAALTVSGPLSNSTIKERKAFTRALMCQCFAP